MAFSLNSKILFANPSFISLKLIPTIVQTRTLVELPIEWKRPEKIPWYDPKQTGDGVLKLEVDMNKTPILVEKSKEIERYVENLQIIVETSTSAYDFFMIFSADENVKKLFNFHFLGRKYAMKRAQQEMVNSVKSHNYDSSSLEAKSKCRMLMFWYVPGK